MAPDVVLEVDHIIPISQGGENEILNLVTSCFDCNRGKGGRKLNEKSEILKQQDIEGLENEKDKYYRDVYTYGRCIVTGKQIGRAHV